MLKKLLILIILSSTFCLMADDETPARFGQIKEQDGLPHRQVHSVVEDQFGILWIGTYQGLIRYDGNQFLPLNPLDSVARLLESSHILTLVEDPEKNIWICTFGDGLVKYSPHEDSYTHYRNDPEDSSSLPSDEVTIVDFDPQGRLWAATTKGLALLQEDAKSFRIFTNDPENEESLIGNYSYWVLCDSKGDIWVSESTGITRLSPRENGRYRFTRYERKVLSSKSPWSLTEDKQGRIWIAFVRNGFGWMDPDTEEFHKIPKIAELNERYTKMMYFDDHGYIWMPQSNEGLLRYHIQSGETKIYKQEICNSSSLGSDFTRWVAPGKNGRLWIALSSGLSYFRPYGKAFKWTQIPSPTPDESPGGLFPLSLTPDNEDNYYIATMEGIMQWDVRGKTFERVLQLNSVRQRSTDRRIYSMRLDHKGRLWLGPVAYGPIIWDPVSQKTTFISKRIGIITDFFEDAQHRMWISTDGNGLALWQEGRDTLQFFHWPDRGPSFPMERFSRILDAGDSKIWLGGNTEGLHLFDTKSLTFLNRYLHDPKDPNSVSSNIILDLVNDENGNLWIATQRGLNYFDQETETFTCYTIEDGLPNNAIKSVIFDDEGYLWIGTENGLSRYDRVQKKFRNFTIEDGLGSPRCGARGVQYNQGVLTFIGDKGLSTIKPERLGPSPSPAAVRLTGIKVMNEPHPMAIAPGLCRELTIGYKENAVTFEYASPEARVPENNEYAYRLEGLEEDWNYVQGRQFANYTALPPQTYTFMVKVIGHNGMQDSEVLEIKLNITPAFWQTNWFKLLIAMVILGIFLAFFWLGKRQLEARHQQDLAEKAAAYKSQFLANMSHEIRTPMHAVMSAAELLSQSDLDEKQGYYLQNIRQSGQNLLALINDILDFTRIEAGKLDFQLQEFRLQKVLTYVRETLDAKTKEQGTTLQIDIAPEIPRQLKGDPVRLGQILLNLLGNAVKFSPGGEVQLSCRLLSMQESGLELEFEVADTGIGIPPEELEDIFDSFKQAENRFETQQVGVGLGLAITKQLIEQQGGEIRVTSELNKGTVFSFFLPFERVYTAPVESPKRGSGDSLPIQMERVLLVEDVLINRELACDMLSSAFPGLDIAEAGSGEEALARLAAGPMPDLILMDIRMPDMDGLTCTQLVRKRYGPTLPILALTASATREEVQRCMQAGLDGLLPKPFTPDQLTQQVIQLMNIHAHNPDLAIDLPGLRHYLGNDESRLQRYVTTARSEVFKHFQHLRMDLAQDDWEKAGISAHTLKTSFRYLGIKPLASICEEIEEACKEKNPNTYIQLVPRAAMLLRGFLKESQQADS